MATVMADMRNWTGIDALSLHAVEDHCYRPTTDSSVISSPSFSYTTNVIEREVSTELSVVLWAITSKEEIRGLKNDQNSILF